MDGRTNQAGIAAALGLGRTTISNHVAKGNIIMDSDNLLHPDEARVQLAHNADITPTDAPDYQTARTDREIAEAKISNLKYEEMEKNLIKKDVVYKAVFDVLRGLRDNLNVMTRRVAAEVSSLDDVKDCEDLLRENINSALELSIIELERQL